MSDLQSILVDPISLQQALENRGGDEPDKIPWIVRLFENPSSWLPLPVQTLRRWFGL